MSADKAKVLELVGAALELTSQQEIDDFLRTACAGDHGVYEKVLALLATYKQAATGPERTPALESGPGEQTIVEAIRRVEVSGTVIDRYKLLEQMGEGGMGTVWLAEQLEPVQRRVALKVIRQGMDSGNVLARFDVERQALALMDHANIAKVLDAGTTSAGRPYFVMELVRGIPITIFCDQQRLSIRERLELFIPVCQAIQHAHQKGIIHRDIKPSNALVAIYDGLPVPKVIDFGIAKATTDQRLTDKTLFTAFEQFIGTPAYMSPEQAEQSGLDIDTRSDIYSLGVLLYELLTGKTPFEPKELLALGLDEMRRTIREKEPLRPSTRVGTLQGEELTSTAKRRGLEGPKLINLLRGDLDWIVMKALEKDRKRRYETANGLAREVERHLNNEPVMARPPSVTYRLGRMVRRHKMAFTALVAIVIVAAGFSLKLYLVLRELRGTAPSFYAKSVALVSEGKFDEALTPIDYALTLLPNEAEYHYLKGNILESLLRLDAARDAYQRVLALRPDYKPARENLELCQKILQANPREKELPSATLLELHGAMLGQGRVDEAQAMARGLLTGDAAAHNEFYDKWRAKLDQAGIRGTLSVDERGRVELVLRGSPIADLTVLRGLPLNALDLESTKVTNLTMLAGMPLDTLNLTRTAVSDLSPLKGMRLRSLQMWETAVTDLSPLAGMHLEFVVLSDKVSDITPLADMPIRHLDGPVSLELRVLRTLPLESINFHKSAISDLRPLRELTKLHALGFFECNKLSDFTALRGMRLHELALGDARITDLAPLRGMALERLSIWRASITDLEPLRGMPLSKLRLESVRNVRDLSPIIGMPLEELYLQDIAATNLAPLAGLPLTKLSLSNTKIANLSLLNGMPLQELWLDGCYKLQDITALQDFKELETLTIPGHIKEIEFLRNMPNLKQLGYADPLPVDAFWKAYDARSK